jgi:Tol biopolymer transport system component
VTTEFDRYARAVNIWSPDSSKLVFTVSYGNGTQSLDFVLETEASGSIDFRVLTFGSLAFWSPK